MRIARKKYDRALKTFPTPGESKGSHSKLMAVVIEAVEEYFLLSETEILKQHIEETNGDQDEKSV